MSADSLLEILFRAEKGDELWLSRTKNATNEDLRLALRRRNVATTTKDNKEVLVAKLLKSFEGAGGREAPRAAPRSAPRAAPRSAPRAAPRCPFSPDDSRKHGYTDEFWTQDCTQYYYREGDEGYGTCARCARASSPSRPVRCPEELVTQRNKKGARLQNGKPYTFVPSCSSDTLDAEGESTELSSAVKVGLSMVVPYAAPYFIGQALMAPAPKEKLRKRPDDGRCEGLTAKGERCKNKGKFDGFCHLHYQ
jgi:hypothetical protein